MVSGEPDNGVGDNPDLGRIFELLVRGQAAQQRLLSDLRDSAQRSLSMAQMFMVTPGAARQAAQMRQGLADPLAGQRSAPLSPRPAPPPGGPSVAPGSPAPGNPAPVGNPLAGLVRNNLPTDREGWQQVGAQVGGTTAQNLQQAINRALFGVWSPYWKPGGQQGHGGGGGSQGSGGGFPPSGYRGLGGYGSYGGGGGQMGAGPYGMGPQGLPPNPNIYFGGPNHPLGPYGPYGPYGPAGPGAGGGHGGGGGGGGGGSSSGVMGWLGRNVPGAGLVQSVFGEVRNQRAKNEYYQNVEGGSNAGGFAERAHEEAYAFTTGGVLSSDEARTAFKGVTRLGYNGRVGDEFSQQGGRQDALDFIYHAKTSYGASVNESLKNLEVVSKNSTLSLNGLNKALKDVSDTAGKAGVNAQMARAQLMSLVQSGEQAGYGAGSIPTAQNIQMGKSSLGRSYEDIDLSGQMSQQYTYMASSNMGMTYNQYTALQTTNPLAASQARAGQNLALLSQIFTQDEINWIKDKAQALGGNLDPNSALSIVPQFLQAFPDHNISVIQQQLAAFGIVQTDDPQKALAYAFNLVAGNNGDLANAQKTAQTTQPTSMANAAKQAKQDGSPFFQDINAGILNFQGQATYDYIKNAKASGQRNPVIENLLRQVGNEGSAKVVVHTSSGQRVMSLDDAVKSHPQEISSGSVQFVSGDEKGRSVADIVGQGNVSSTTDWSAEAAKSSGRTGQSLSSWQKTHKDDSTAGAGSGTGANGKVVVDLTDAAKQLLTIASTSGIAGANGEGAPPINSYNFNASR